MQELYDLFFRRFLVEIRSDPDVLVELPEGAIPMGAHPTHQVVLELRDVGNCQLKDLLLKFHSVFVLIIQIGLLWVHFYFWNMRIILFRRN